MQEPNTVQTLLQSAMDSKLAVPIYQRSYTWTIKQVQSLLNFMINSYDDETNQQRIPLSPILLATSEEEEKTQPSSFMGEDVALPQDYFLVVDGRQRTDSLLRAYLGQFDNDLFYSVRTKQFEVKSRPHSSHFVDVPVSALINPQNWNALRRDLFREGKEELEQSLNRVYDNIRLFRIATQTAHDLDFEGQVSWFNLSNTAGTKLKMEDQIVALATRHGIIFKQMFARLPHVFRQNNVSTGTFAIQDRFYQSSIFLSLIPVLFDSTPSSKNRIQLMRLFRQSEIAENERQDIQNAINHFPNLMDRALKFIAGEFTNHPDNNYIRIRSIEIAFIIGAVMDNDYDLMSDRKKQVVVDTIKQVAIARESYPNLRNAYTTMRERLEQR